MPPLPELPHVVIKAIPGFIQMHMPLLLLSLMVQSGHGVTQVMEVHMPLITI
jgi:hypothetical protein